MPSRKVLKTVATVFLVAGNVFMLGFLAILLFFTANTKLVALFRYSVTVNKLKQAFIVVLQGKASTI